MNENMHKKHRERMRKKFREYGMDAFAPHEMLEFLLFYTYQQGNTNPVGHALLGKFGSLSKVLEAPYEALLTVDGIGDSSALLITFVGELIREYYVDKNKKPTVLTDTDAMGKYLLPFFMGVKNEIVVQLCLDNCGKVLHCGVIHEGSVNVTEITARTVVSDALIHNATIVIIAHNHPSGHAIPSEDDILTTGKLQQALAAVGVHLRDHIIVADDDFVSMMETKRLTSIFFRQSNL
ncbi:MAG: DNA repair protein RadC [Oscillospiraceae bacterium]|nr:DNA repair protein RadC [Oscillospiraceae bacterium]